MASDQIKSAEVPEAMGDAEILSANYPDGDENGPTVSAPDFELICFAKQVIAARDAQWQSTRLRAAAVPEGWKLVPVEPTPEMVGAFADATEDEPIWEKAEQHDRDHCIANFIPCYRAMLTAAPQAPAPAAAVDAASDDMTSKWCWWLGDDETFHIADTEFEAHDEAQYRIDGDCEPGHERKYHVARVQHPIDSLGLDWLARNVAEHIEENVCCWCDENTGAEEPSIALSKEDRNALGLMVAGFLREKASVDWWTYDKTTITEHAYVSGSNDNAPDAAMSAQAGKGGAE